MQGHTQGGHGGFGSSNGWMIVHNITVPINWEAIPSAENSGKLSGRGSASNPAGGAHSAPPYRYGTESGPLTRDPTRPGCIWPDDPTRSLSVLWIERLFWRRCATNEWFLPNVSGLLCSTHPDMDPDRRETEKRETYIQYRRKNGNGKLGNCFFCIMLNVPEASSI